MKKSSIKRRGFILGALVFLLLAITTQAYLAALCILLAIYVIDTLIFSDHIYYDPKSDYHYDFGASTQLKARIENGHLVVDTDQGRGFDSCVLAIKINANLLGHIVDPYVDIQAGNTHSRQYFERGVQGIRYLNLSRFCAPIVDKSEPIKFSAGFCHYQTEDLTLSGFSNTNHLDKRILIISPHADDAELAAFGFYKNAASVFIACITAGESDATAFKRMAKGDLTQASQIKGQLRAWDSVAIPMMAGRHVDALNLGHFDNSLKKMYAQPQQHIPAESHGLTSGKLFRVYNKRQLPNDSEGVNTWDALVGDLASILHKYQAELIVTPHPLLDPHTDHIYATRAVLAACDMEQLTPDFLLYANHYHHTDIYPFGLEHSDLPLPPQFCQEPVADKLYSHAVSEADQLAKVFALQMMHDLNRPQPFKKQVRRWLQRLIGRSKMPYGQDEYLRKAIRQQELFFVTSAAGVKRFFNDY